MPGLSEAQRYLFLPALAAVPFLTLIKLNIGLANAFSRFAISFLPDNAVRPLLFLTGLLVAWRIKGGLDSNLAISIHAIAIITVAIPLTFYLYRSTKRRLLPGKIKLEVSLWNRTAASLLVLGLFTNYFPEITVILIGFVLTSPDIGIYNVAFRLALLISFVLFAVDAFTAPALARHYRRRERTELVRVVREATILRFLAGVAAVVLFFLLGDLVLGIFGEEFVEGYDVLIILSLGQLAVASVGPSVRLLSVSGHQNEGLQASAIALLVWLVAAAILVPAFAVTGAAISTFLALMTWSAALRRSVKNYLEIDPLIVARDVRQS